VLLAIALFKHCTQLILGNPTAMAGGKEVGPLLPVNLSSCYPDVFLPSHRGYFYLQIAVYRLPFTFKELI
jgi:hypothetical protein